MATEQIEIPEEDLEEYMTFDSFEDFKKYILSLN